MLQVGVHDDHRLAARVVEAGRQRDLLAEVTAERDGADARIARVVGLDDGERVVEAAVVHEHDLPGGRDPLQHRREAREERADAGRLVVDRDDDAEFDGGGHHADVGFRGQGTHRTEFPALLKSGKATRPNLNEGGTA
jgi:hypothetical protein